MPVPGKPLLIVKTGDTIPTIRAQLGDYDWMFLRYLGDQPTVVVAAHEGEALPDPASVAGVIITGSPSSVTDPEPWVAPLAEWSRRLVDSGTPTLGVCYGHQLLAQALGGEVAVNPACYEIGTISVDLTDAGRADPLFGWLAQDTPSLSFNAVHADIVTALPPGAVRLASNEASVNQAFKIGDRVWTVQFHPEFSDDVMRMYVDGRAHMVRGDAERRGLDPEARLAEVAAGVRTTPCGPALLERFVHEVVCRGEDA